MMIPQVERWRATVARVTKDETLQSLILAIIHVESTGDPNAAGAAGEIGLGQILPATARNLGVPQDRLTDPMTNITLMYRVLSQLRTTLRKGSGTDLQWVVSSYNCGIKKDDQAGWIPRCLSAALLSNQAYVDRVLSILYADIIPGQPPNRSPSATLVGAPGQSWGLQLVLFSALAVVVVLVLA